MPDRQTNPDRFMSHPTAPYGLTLPILVEPTRHVRPRRTDLNQCNVLYHRLPGRRNGPGQNNPHRCDVLNLDRTPRQAKSPHTLSTNQAHSYRIMTNLPDYPCRTNTGPVDLSIRALLSRATTNLVDNPHHSHSFRLAKHHRVDLYRAAPYGHSLSSRSNSTYQSLLNRNSATIHIKPTPAFTTIRVKPFQLIPDRPTPPNWYSSLRFDEPRIYMPIQNDLPTPGQSYHPQPSHIESTFRIFPIQTVTTCLTSPNQTQSTNRNQLRHSCTSRQIEPVRTGATIQRRVTPNWIDKPRQPTPSRHSLPIPAVAPMECDVFKPKWESALKADSKESALKADSKEEINK